MVRDLTPDEIKKVKEFAGEKGLAIYMTETVKWVIYKEGKLLPGFPHSREIDYLFKGDVVSAMIFLINWKG